ncbi:MAG: PEP-CTERM sorting domain-containing protein, partial [Phormidium sp.]
TMLTTAQLLTAGLNFGNFSAAGTETIGFQLSRSLLGSGSYMANVFVECGNDGVALAGNLTKVPEPSGIVGLALVGLTAAGSMLRKRRLASVNIVE